MSNTDAPTYYWDSCVFLSLLEKTPNRFSVIDELARQASERKIAIVTSVLSITEVAFTAVEKKGAALSQSEEQGIDSFWTPTSPFTLVEFHSLQAREARRLMRSALENGWSLKPADAIHLAAAVENRAEKFCTYDERLDKFAAVVPFEIERPYAAVLNFQDDPAPS